ncbi:MAG: hypothetical protein ACUZ8H_00180 [Candidatus Anammoxibacter sp.]
MTTKGNTNDMKVLKEFKEKYELTWPEVAEALGRKLRGVEEWNTNRKVSMPCKILLQVFLDHPDIYRKYKGGK